MLRDTTTPRRKVKKYLYKKYLCPSPCSKLPLHQFASKLVQPFLSYGVNKMTFFYIYKYKLESKSYERMEGKKYLIISDPLVSINYQWIYASQKVFTLNNQVLPASNSYPCPSKGHCLAFLFYFYIFK